MQLEVGINGKFIRAKNDFGGAQLRRRSSHSDSSADRIDSHKQAEKVGNSSRCKKGESSQELWGYNSQDERGCEHEELADSWRRSRQEMQNVALATVAAAYHPCPSYTPVCNASNILRHLTGGCISTT